MRKILKKSFMVISLIAGTNATAGQITNLQVVDGGNAPTAWVNYTNADGTGSNSAYTYADPQVSGGTTAPVYYCVDLWHDNYLGSTYQFSAVPSITFAASTFADADNRIGWILSQDPDTTAARAAAQLAIWYTIDSKGFSMSTSDSTVTSEYNSLISFAGYDPGQTYQASFWQAVHDPGNSLYQDLVSAAPVSGPSALAVPEPSSLILASIACGLSIAIPMLRKKRMNAVNPA